MKKDDIINNSILYIEDDYRTLNYYNEINV